MKTVIALKKEINFKMKNNKKDTLHPGWRKSQYAPWNFTGQDDGYSNLFDELIIEKRIFTKKRIKILEIGPGTGKFALRLLENPELDIETYTILDSTYCIHHPKETLKHHSNVQYFISDDFEELYKQEFDLIVAIQCLSETPVFYYQDILKNIKYEYMFILDDGNLEGDPFSDFMNKHYLSSTVPSSRQRVTTNMYNKQTQVLFHGKSVKNNANENMGD